MKFKRTIKFKDSLDKIVIAEIRIKNKNNEKEFAMSFQRDGGYGQTGFSPFSIAQKELYDLWENYHLNGMKGGLPIQEEAVKEIEKYDERVKKLKELELYSVDIPENIPEGYTISIDHEKIKNKTYEYGTGWVYKILPKDIIEITNKICNKIEEEEIERIQRLDEMEWEDIDDDKIVALGRHLELSPEEAKEDIINDDYHYYSYSGLNYIVCTEEEANELFEEYMKNYIDEFVLSEIPEYLHNYFDADSFIEDVKINDGRGSTLSGYDGRENEELVNGEYYFIYKQ